ncbi:hypothetical protein F383_30970 [Gossypium arboreum]|uniref:Uncharacterized protein n=1 Tax=Gossypium arboreum TaxID=29729 RepID=A0A0B0PIQ0_GOSAR|nr:hypothetical protein F383_30970 [Gossypium arboreum]
MPVSLLVWTKIGHL